jgi:hypothetical protein
MSAAVWPASLPLPQLESELNHSRTAIDAIDVLTGPTRARLARRHAPPSFEFQCWMTPTQAQSFENWYQDAILNGNGELFLPWLGGGRVVVFADEYVWAPMGIGWILQALVVQTRIDPTLCDAEIAATFDTLRDPGAPTSDVIQDDGAAADIVKDDFDISTFAPC